MVTVPQALAIALEHHKADRLNEAAAIYRQVLQVQPDSFDALHLLGLVLRRHGDEDGAVALIRQAIMVSPNSADAFYNLGNGLRARGRIEEAIAAFRASLALRPDQESPLTNLGNTLMDGGDPAGAETAYRRVIELHPRHADAWNNLGAALKALMRMDEAIAAFRQALAIAPSHNGAYNNLAMTFQTQGRHDEAVACFLRVLALAPDYWAAHSNMLLCLNYDARISNAELLAEHVAWDARHGRGRAGPVEPHANSAVPDRPLRIGYVSPDLGRHPVGYYLARVIPNHDRRQVEPVFYSGRVGEDDFTQLFRDHAVAWRSTLGVSDEALAHQIRADRIDILVDLTGHTAGNRLQVFARKPAPVQAAWIGYFNTTGLSTMDYVIMDPVTVPAGQERWFVEEVVRLPDGRFCYAPPEFAPPVAAPPCLERGHITFGSFNNLSKVTDEVVRLWAAVLKAVPDSRMVIKWPTLASVSEVNRLTRAFAGEGVDAGRLEFRPASRHPDMLAQYGDVDIALDTFPFCGGLTSSEALWMGVPIVTLPGPRPVSRQTLGFLTAVGLTELAGDTPAGYVEIAAALAGDRQRLATLRQGLRERLAASPLCDGERFTRHLETAYRTMWQRWCRGAGAVAPGAVTPGAVAPGAVTPGAVAPGAVTR